MHLSRDLLLDIDIKGNDYYIDLHVMCTTLGVESKPFAVLAVID